MEEARGSGLFFFGTSFRQNDVFKFLVLVVGYVLLV